MKMALDILIYKPNFIISIILLHISMVPVVVNPQETRAQDNFYFDPNPERQTDVTEGDDVTLKCDVSNRHHIVFKWEMNGKRVANTSRRFMRDSDLWIERVDRELDGGTFHCIATNVTTNIATRSRSALLNIMCEYQYIFYFTGVYAIHDSCRPI